MCGLVGFLGGAFQHDAGCALLRKMSDQMLHRGPDDGGTWFDKDMQLGLGHRRLSIVDLSKAGHQPMLSGSGRYVLVLNGEIYNHYELRKQLEAEYSVAFRGHSDTETLLASFDTWGIEATLQQSVGMFAFALWDKKERALVLGRDRLGEKPLFYGWQGNSFLFASSLKSLQVHPAFLGRVNRDALTLLMRHSTVPAPHSIWAGINKLPPGHLLKLSHGQMQPTVTSYWSVKQAVQKGSNTPFQGSLTDAVSALEGHLKDAIAMQVMADVPVGAFLSGGVDSSTVTALMQAQSKHRVRTFSIGFSEAQYDEAPYAKAIAKHLGTEHTELYVTPKEAMSVIPKLPIIYDEPFSDSSQIPTFLVSQLAREQVTVALSGDGADELFGGYSRYIQAAQFWKMVSRVPRVFRHVLAKGALKISPDIWRACTKPLIKLVPEKRLPSQFNVASAGIKIHKVAQLFSNSNIASIYRGMMSHWQFPESLVRGGREPEHLFTQMSQDSLSVSDIEWMMAMDMQTYLPDDILTKVDRAAMGVSLETRVPFLDHRVVEFACSLPLAYKVNGAKGKWLLRELLYQYVPKSLVERPKMGFGVPIADWLRGPLREWGEALLSEQLLREGGFFHTESIRDKWHAHLAGRGNWHYLLWDVLMFQLWLTENSGVIRC